MSNKFIKLVVANLLFVFSEAVASQDSWFTMNRGNTIVLEKQINNSFKGERSCQFGFDIDDTMGFHNLMLQNCHVPPLKLLLRTQRDGILSAERCSTEVKPEVKDNSALNLPFYTVQRKQEGNIKHYPLMAITSRDMLSVTCNNRELLDSIAVVCPEIPSGSMPYSPLHKDLQKILSINYPQGKYFVQCAEATSFIGFSTNSILTQKCYTNPQPSLSTAPRNITFQLSDVVNPSKMVLSCGNFWLPINLISNELVVSASVDPDSARLLNEIYIESFKSGTSIEDASVALFQQKAKIDESVRKKLTLWV